MGVTISKNRESLSYQSDNLPRLDDLRLFAEVARHRSVSAAARGLGITKQTVSRRLSELEQTLGVELARRTTRRLALTDAGRFYAERCREVVRLAEEASREASTEGGTVSGQLRVSADPTFGESLLPELVLQYAKAHAAVSVEVLLTSRKIDLLEEGVDVAFRIGPPPDVTYLVAARLGPARLVTVATPEYLRARGRPKRPKDLEGHDCIGLQPSPEHRGWPLSVDGRVEMIPVREKVRTGGVRLALRAVLGGLGIGHLPEFAVRSSIRAGNLRQVLAKHSPELGGVHLVYPHTRLPSARVRTFVDVATKSYRSLGA